MALVGVVLAGVGLLTVLVLTVVAGSAFFGAPRGIADLPVLSTPVDQDVEMTDGTWVVYQYVGRVPSQTDPHPARALTTLVPNDVQVSSAEHPVIGVVGDLARPDTVRHPSGMFTAVLLIAGPSQGRNHVRITSATPTKVLIGPSVMTTYSRTFDGFSAWTWGMVGGVIGLIAGLILIPLGLTRRP